MQRVSSRMGCTINHMYSVVGHLGFPIRNSINYESNNAYSTFFKVDTQGDVIEFPIFARESTMNRLIRMFGSGHRSTIIIPFVSDLGATTANVYRTSDTLIRSLIEFSSSPWNMYSCAKTNKDEVYYGANGLLFDKDMNLLFLSSIECEVDDNIVVYRRVKAYVHPSVFYSDGAVEKCLINKVIPYSLKEGVVVHGGFQSLLVKNLVNYSNPSDYTTSRRAIPEVIVTDVKDRFFCKPTLPSVSFKDDDINDVLNRNLNDVFGIMRL